MLGYFCQTNILGFILYFIKTFVISLKIISEAFSSTLGFFSLKVFHINLVFFFFISYFFIVSLIIKSGIRAIKFFDLVNGNHEIRNSLVGSQYQIFVVAS